MKDRMHFICDNCGYEYGYHKAENDLCPFSDRDAGNYVPNRKWRETKFKHEIEDIYE